MTKKNDLYVAIFVSHNKDIASRDTIIPIGVFDSEIQAKVACIDYIQKIRNDFIENFPEESYNPIVASEYGYSFTSFDNSEEFITYHEAVLFNEEYKLIIDEK